MTKLNSIILNSPPVYPVSGESLKAFEYFLFYAYAPVEERDLKNVFNKHKEQNPDDKSKFTKWQELKNLFNWVDRARRIDMWYAEKIVKEMSSKVVLQTELVKYRNLYCNFFYKNIEWSGKLQDIGIALTNPLVSTDGRDEDYRGKIQNYKNLSTAYNQMSSGIKTNFESWGFLLGLDKLIESFNAEVNAEIHNLPTDDGLI